MLTATERKAHKARVLAWLADNGVASTGAALSAALEGVRDLPTLYRLNMADGVAARTNTDGDTLPGAIRDHDLLDGYGTVLGEPVRDPETGAYWLTVRQGTEDPTDVELAPGTAVTVLPRPRTMPPWLAAAHAEYRDARDAWEDRRDAWALGYATERAEYADRMAQAGRPDPAPRFADYVREHAARNREDDHTEEARRADARAARKAAA